MTEPDMAELLKQTHDMVLQIKTVVVGYNGRDGLVGDLLRLHKQHEELEQRHNRLDVKVSRVIGILVGSGVLTGGIWVVMR